MPPSPHGRLAADALRQQIARLYLEGYDQSQIGEQLGLTKQGVSYHVCALREDWRASAEADSHHHFTQDLQKLGRLESELWSAWAASKCPKERTVTEQVEGEPGLRKTSHSREDQTGGAQYLELLLKIFKRRADMLGYDAPKRFKVDLDSLDDAALARIAGGDFTDLAEG